MRRPEVDELFEKRDDQENMTRKFPDNFIDANHPIWTSMAELDFKARQLWRYIVKLSNSMD